MRKRLFAMLLARFAGVYERLVEHHKRTLFRQVTPGSLVVEIGTGTGTNFRYLPDSIDYVGLEPNVHLMQFLQHLPHGWQVKTERLQDAAASLTGQADYVISTLVLCSIPDRKQALADIVRMLKPSGKFLFIEHVAAPPSSFQRLLQRVLRLSWKWCFDGCDLCNATVVDLQSAAFLKVEFERVQLKLGPIGNHIVGIAHKA
jgi:SAM-dependent methyltransferase